MGLIPGSGKSLGVGNGNPLQYSCLENSMDRGAWRAIAHGHKELDMTERLSNHNKYIYIYIYFPTYTKQSLLEFSTVFTKKDGPF